MRARRRCLVARKSRFPTIEGLHWAWSETLKIFGWPQAGNIRTFANIIATVVPKAYPVRAAGLRPSKHSSRSPARGWTRAARCCLVLLACLAQLWMPVQHRHAPGIAAHSVVHETAASSSGVTPARFAAG